MSIPGGIEDHPDLKDDAWIRAANRRAKQEVRRQRRQARMRRHGGKVVSAVALVVIIGVVAALYQAGRFGELSLPDLRGAYKGVDTSQPFARTPAEKWADGEAGIVAPDQDPEYAPVYEAVRKAVVAAHLDPRMVVERDREPFLALLAQPSAEDVEPITDTVLWTRTKEGTKLLPVPVKVDGRMWPGRDENGLPVVHTSYRFAYAFDPGEMKNSLFEQTDLLAMVRADVDFQLDAEGLWVIKVDGYHYMMACRASKDGYLAPMFTEKRKSDGESSERGPEEWFASNAPIPDTGGCD
ncbi:hypothetical protein BBK82_04575 [Lentzea guizhouensis]|uniref:Uncharacterized protein n=1 Tax=Lentzea guizhouensis TaxID=1586287 RepID=A0A1B2HCM9_9PSEU|nr:hypothetical protein [Lentzea guizhouensis]ANZ35462.1 hypothetical protein BBK82_04575 [Lentzea guizhouensis]